MKKLVNYLSFALLILLIYFVVPVANATKDPTTNNKKECLFHGGCKFKENRSCYGAPCGGTQTLSEEG